MGYVQRSIRFPEELDALIRARADREDRSFSYVVVRALESALSDRTGRPAGRADAPPLRVNADASAPSRASAPLVDEQGRRASGIPGVKSARELMLERQAKLNEGKG